MLVRIKRILGLSIDETSEDFLLDQFIGMYSNALMLEVDEPVIPVSLEFILVEAVVSRWNRRGSEGLQSESVDVVSQTFDTDFFAPYKKFIESYKANKRKASGSNRIRLL